jgi:hypothetical protein
MARVSVNVPVTDVEARVFASNAVGGADGPAVSEVNVTNTGAEDLYVRIPTLHGATDFGWVGPGMNVSFRCVVGSMPTVREVYLKTASSKTTTAVVQPTFAVAG